MAYHHGNSSIYIALKKYRNKAKQLKYSELENRHTTHLGSYKETLEIKIVNKLDSIKPNQLKQVK